MEFNECKERFRGLRFLKEIINKGKWDGELIIPLI